MAIPEIAAVAHVAQATGLDMTTVIASSAAAITAVIAAAFPIMKLVERWSATKADSSKYGAESTLYKSLERQIEQSFAAIERLSTEKSAWLSDHAEMKARILRLEELESQNKILKDKLDSKDAQIAGLVTEVMRKTNQIGELRERIHQLEMRLAKDERDWCGTCKFSREARMTRIGDAA